MSVSLSSEFPGEAEDTTDTDQPEDADDKRHMLSPVPEEATYWKSVKVPENFDMDDFMAEHANERMWYEEHEMKQLKRIQQSYGIEPIADLRHLTLPVPHAPPPHLPFHPPPEKQRELKQQVLARISKDDLARHEINFVAFFTRPQTKQACFVILLLVVLVLVALWITLWATSGPFGEAFPTDPPPNPGTMHTYQLGHASSNVSLTVLVHANWVLLFGNDLWSAVLYPNDTNLWFDGDGRLIHVPNNQMTYTLWTTPGKLLLLPSKELDHYCRACYSLDLWQKHIPVPDNFDSIRIPSLRTLSLQSPQPFYLPVQSSTTLHRNWFEPIQWENLFAYNTVWGDVVSIPVVQDLARRTELNEHNLQLVLSDNQTTMDIGHLVQNHNALLDCNNWQHDAMQSPCILYQACSVQHNEETQSVGCGENACACRQALQTALLEGMPACGNCLASQDSGCACWTAALFYAAVLDHLPCYENNVQCSDDIRLRPPCGFQRQCKYSVGLNCAEFLSFCDVTQVKRLCVKCCTLP